MKQKFSVRRLPAEKKANGFFVTKKRLLWEMNNDMCHNWYFEFYARFYDADGKTFRRFSFVLWFDVEDLLEYFDKDTYTKADVMAYADELAYSIEGPRSNTVADRQEFRQWANETIAHYNSLLAT